MNVSALFFHFTGYILYLSLPHLLRVCVCVWKHCSVRNRERPDVRVSLHGFPWTHGGPTVPHAWGRIVRLRRELFWTIKYREQGRTNVSVCVFACVCLCVYKLLSDVTDWLDLAWDQSRQHNRVILSWHRLMLNSSYCSWDAEVTACAHVACYC